MDSWRDSLPRLAGRLRGPCFTPDDGGYAAEISVFNQAVRHCPGIVVGATSSADIRESVLFAAEHDLPVAVLNTGHGPTVAAGPQSLLITTKRMTRVEVDERTATARVEAGVRFGQLVEVAASHGLAPLPGSSPGVGVVGYTLSGGASSTMGRLYGWAADHVRALDVVTADGRLRRASPTSERDLFGALLGGKSNFGVVTAMECALFPVTRLYAGALYYPGTHVREVLRAYRYFTDTAPDAISTGVALMNFPALPDLPPFMRGKLAVALRVSYVGDAATGEHLIRPLRDAAPVLMDTVAEIPYSDFASISADPADPAPAVEHFGLLRVFTDDTVERIADAVAPTTDTRINLVDIRHLGGAFRNPPPTPNAVGARDAAFAFFSLTVVPPGHRLDAYRDSGRELMTALAPWMHPMASPTFQGPADATEAGTRRAYDVETYEFLRTAKDRYDPDNRFRVNHNIPPRQS
jgi:FAD/FMN-containing dehydrogenase